VSTLPSGSASAITSASTAEPRRARVRICAARRARLSLTVSTMLHVFRNRFVGASRPTCPCKLSTRTTDGTSGGQRFASRNVTINAAAARDCSANRLTPPESKTSVGLTPLSASPAAERCSRRQTPAGDLASSACQPVPRAGRDTAPSRRGARVDGVPSVPPAEGVQRPAVGAT